jgi:hypothetical protein
MDSRWSQFRQWQKWILCQICQEVVYSPIQNAICGGDGDGGDEMLLLMLLLQLGQADFCRIYND